MFLRNLTILGVLTILSAPTAALALDLGFESLFSVDASDNIGAANSGLEEEGQIGFASFGVYGEQRGRSVAGAFSGEIETRKRLDDEDSDFSTLTRFLGAAEFAITPRSLSWYAGDILGAVRADDAVQPIDDREIRRRNVFVTGPTFVYDIDSFTRTEARLLYVNQSEDDIELEQLYNASFLWQNEPSTGTLVGVRLSDVFTDNPEETGETDFNRGALSAFWQRERGRLNLYAELGVTRYDADEESLTGASAQLRAARRFTPQTEAYVSLSRDLRDQTLNTVESLLDDGNGVEPEVDGFFDETRLELGYSFQTNITVWTIGAGITDSDYRLLAGTSGDSLDSDRADQLQSRLFASFSRSLSPRLRSTFDVSAEQQTFDNLVDETDSILASALLEYSLTRSWRLEAGVRHDRANGVRTRVAGDVATEEDIDTTENRVTLGLRWAPPSRASQDLTIELKSLLQ